jgi:competence protein ComGC
VYCLIAILLLLLQPTLSTENEQITKGVENVSLTKNKGVIKGKQNVSLTKNDIKGKQNVSLTKNEGVIKRKQIFRQQELNELSEKNITA